MNHFIGTYECKIDAKGRILIPSALKKQISTSNKEGFVIKRGLFNNCIELYPFDQWKFVMNKIDQLMEDGQAFYLSVDCSSYTPTASAGTAHTKKPS